MKAIENKKEDREQCVYKSSKLIENNTQLINIKLCLHSLNGQEYEFSTYGEIYEVYKDGRKKHREPCISGAITEYISKYFPELNDIVNLHLHNTVGLSILFPIENGMHSIWKKEYDYFSKDFNITKNTAIELRKYYEFGCNHLQQYYIEYLIYKTGFLKKSEEKAKKALKHLEYLSGEKFVNDRKIKNLKDRQKNIINFVESQPFDYYTIQEVNKRNGAYFKHIKNISYIIQMNEINNKIKRAENLLEVFQYIYNILGIVASNAYFHNNEFITSNKLEISFSPSDYEYKIKNDKKILTKEQFNEFLEKVDFDELPCPVEFTFIEDKNSYFNTTEEISEDESKNEEIKWYKENLNKYKENLKTQKKKKEILKFINDELKFSLYNVNIFDNFVCFNGDRQFTNFNNHPIINTIEQIRKLKKYSEPFNKLLNMFNVRFSPNNYDDTQRVLTKDKKYGYREVTLLTIDDVLNLKRENENESYIISK